MVSVKSYVERLQEQLNDIEQKMLELLDASTISHSDKDPDSYIVDIALPHYWGETDEKQKRLQMEVLKLYKPWIEHVRLLFLGATDEIAEQINETDTFVTDWVQKESIWDVPESVEAAKAVFSRRIQSFVKLLQMLESPKPRRIIVVPDTNALISCSDFANYQRVAGQPDFTLVIMPTVLSELDQLKITARDNGFREKVKSIITRIKGLRVQGSLIEGVIINKTVTVRMEAREPDFGHTLSWLDSGNNDDKVVASILELQRQEPSAVVILSTGDINLQNKAEMAHIPFVEPPGT
jgi:rRNA-processing protein FCF1